MAISGRLYAPKSNQYTTCSALISTKHVVFNDESNNQWRHLVDDLQFGEPLPGQAQEVILPNHYRFLPDDDSFRWPSTPSTKGIVEKLEQNSSLILSTIILCPLLIYAIWFKGVPAAAVYMATILPESVVTQMGEQSMNWIKRTVLEPSELTTEQQNQVNTLWNNTLNQLQLDATQYKLGFFKSEVFGANAFALPHGQIVVTDALILKMADHPNALRAVILHEMGHIEKQHSVRMAAQSAAGAIALTMIFGDLEGFAEIVLGTSTTILQQRFSQKMETEADEYALSHLAHYGYDPKDLAKALTIISDEHNEDTEPSHTWSQYLSTHPSTESRIQHALNYQK